MKHIVAFVFSTSLVSGCAEEASLSSYKNGSMYLSKWSSIYDRYQKIARDEEEVSMVFTATIGQPETPVEGHVFDIEITFNGTPMQIRTTGGCSDYTPYNLGCHAITTGETNVSAAEMPNEFIIAAKDTTYEITFQESIKFGEVESKLTSGPSDTIDHIGPVRAGETYWVAYDSIGQYDGDRYAFVYIFEVNESEVQILRWGMNEKIAAGENSFPLEIQEYVRTGDEFVETGTQLVILMEIIQEPPNESAPVCSGIENCMSSRHIYYSKRIETYSRD